MPLQPLTPDSMDDLLAAGNRRTGEFVYRTQCPSCASCLPIRIDCSQFRFNKHWRREFNRGERQLTTSIGPLQSSQDRVDLFNRHRSMRGLARQDAAIDLEEYHWGFIKSCFHSFEFAYRESAGSLVGLAVCDQGNESLSAVYTFYEPEFHQASVGTYSILKQIDYCQKQQLRFLYLGFYVAGSLHMKYKERFTPQQRLIDGNWQEFV